MQRVTVVIEYRLLLDAGMYERLKEDLKDEVTELAVALIGNCTEGSVHIMRKEDPKPQAEAA